MVSEAIKEKINGVLKEHDKSARSALEIGPGNGAITDMVLDLGLPVTAIEKDESLAEGLGEKFKKLEVLSADAEEFDLSKIDAEMLPTMIVGNLPYYAATDIILNVLSLPSKISSAHFMVQREVALKFGSDAGEEYYSKYSVWAKAFYGVRIEFNVKQGAFSPPPKVLSAFISFIPLKAPLIDEEESAAFFKFCKEMFIHPRKKFLSNFEGEGRTVAEAFLEKYGVKKGARPAEISHECFAGLFSAKNDTKLLSKTGRPSGPMSRG